MDKFCFFPQSFSWPFLQHAKKKDSKSIDAHSRLYQTLFKNVAQFWLVQNTNTLKNTLSNNNNNRFVEMVYCFSCVAHFVFCPTIWIVQVDVDAIHRKTDEPFFLCVLLAQQIKNKEKNKHSSKNKINNSPPHWWMECQIESIFYFLQMGALWCILCFYVSYGFA